MILPPQEFLDLCSAIGARVPDWVQGPGGNVSQKQDGKLWIKASGVRLDQIQEEGSTACVGLEISHDMTDLIKESSKNDDERMETSYSELIKSSSKKDSKLGRASMETGFHLILERRYVLHFHSLSAVLLAYKAGRDPGLMKRLNAGNLKVCLIPATRPGLELTKIVKTAPPSDIYLLENHGVILHSDSPDILSKWQKLESDFIGIFRIEEVLDSLKAPFKIYFPDTAVFREELLKFLSKTADGEFEIRNPKETLRLLKENRDFKSLNLFEIWWATVMLYRTCAELAEIGEDISSTVAALPTETFRKSKE